MATRDDIESAAKRMGGEGWVVVADIVEDAEFQTILNDQQKQFVADVRQNPENIRSYRSQFTDVIAKYFAWVAYNKSHLDKLRAKTNSYIKRVEDNSKKLDVIEKTSKALGGATTLLGYADLFEKSAGKHERNAEAEFKKYLISLLVLALITWSAFFFPFVEFERLQNLISVDLKGLPFNAAIFALKAIIIIFAFQITQFFRKNYGAEKHLQEIYQHRSDVLKSLRLVYDSINEENITERDRILSAGVLLAYERGETGYITTKEGAGSSGDGIISDIFRRTLNG